MHSLAHSDFYSNFVQAGDLWFWYRIWNILRLFHHFCGWRRWKFSIKPYWHHHNTRSWLPTSPTTIELPKKLDDCWLSLSVEILDYATFAPIVQFIMRHMFVLKCSLSEITFHHYSECNFKEPHVFLSDGPSSWHQPLSNRGYHTPSL